MRLNRILTSPPRLTLMEWVEGGIKHIIIQYMHVFAYFQKRDTKARAPNCATHITCRGVGKTHKGHISNINIHMQDTSWHTMELESD